MRRRLLVLVGLGAALAVVAGFLIWSQLQPPPRPASFIRAGVVPEATPPPEETTDPQLPKPPDTTKPSRPPAAQIALPGAQPFAARIENYRHDASLWKLVNKRGGFTTPTYRPADLTVVDVPTKPGRGQEERSVRAVILPDLRRLLTDARSAGIDIRVGSGYRSYATQLFLYDSYVRQHGRAAADRFSARPGTSEHQSGLVIDFDSADGRCWVDQCFEATPAGRWLAANAHRYGFHLRYQKGKEAVTGFVYEPWHFRYVGPELATALYQANLTLEEAQPYLQQALAALKKQGTVR